MPWNGSGTYTLPYNWVNDANASIPITASRVDGQDGDIANGLNNCLTRDGQGTATANLSMSGFKHTNCATGVADTDYATMAQLNLKASLASPTFTGVPAAPTPVSSDNSTTIATTAYVKANLVNYAPLASPTITGATLVSPTLTGAPTLPTSGTKIGAHNGLIYETSTDGSVGIRAGSSGNVFFRFDANGTFYALNSGVSSAGALTGASLQIGSGTSIPKITVSTSAPGTLALNEIWFQRAP